MIARDFLKLTLGSIFAHRLRAGLTTLGISVGVAAVVLLTSIGEGVHHFILSEFTQFGTNLIGINPGRATTFGTSVGVFGSVRPLTIEDAGALERVAYVEATVALLQGNAAVEAGPRTRRTTVYGTGSEFPEVFSFDVAIGEFLPPDDPRAPRALAVLGAKMRKELFGARNPLGELIRVGGDRYRVIGVMAPKGTVIGFDLDDTVYIPAARAQELFGREGLQEIDVLYTEGAPVDEVVAGIHRVLGARHGGEDFTITTQQQMLEVLGSILDVLTVAVGALGGISLLVGGVGIFTIMTIAVRERTAEIGLLRALGSRRSQVLAIFLGEAVALGAFGGLLGLLLGVAIGGLLGVAAPALPVRTPLGFVLLAEAIAVLIGIVAGILPAARAARFEPVDALRAE